MALVVEDGTGVLNADSWVTMAEAATYANRMGNTAFAEADAEVVEPALRRAVLYLDAVYGSRYAGLPTQDPTEQSLSWPRKGVVLDTGYAWPDDEIPVNLKRAQVEAAMLEWATPGSLMPTTTPLGKKSVQVGPIAVTYADPPKAGTVGKPPVFSTIEGLMLPFLDANKSGDLAFLLRA